MTKSEVRVWSTARFGDQEVTISGKPQRVLKFGRYDYQVLVRLHSTNTYSNVSSPLSPPVKEHNMPSKPTFARRLVSALELIGIETSYEKTPGIQTIIVKTRAGNMSAILVESDGFTVWDVDGIHSFTTDSYTKTLERTKSVHERQ